VVGSYASDGGTPVRVLWTLVKIVIALAVAIPLSILVLATALGILGTVIGVAILALKVAVIALIGYGAFRLVGHVLGKPAPRKVPPALPPTDRYYDAAMRELDRELGDVPR
jgi:hypothetical protein